MMTDKVEMQAPENGAKPAKKQILLDVKIDKDRLMDYVTLDEYIAFEDGNAKSSKSIVAACLWNASEGCYVEYEEALALMGKMSLRQSVALFERLKEDLAEEAVPKEFVIVSE